MRISVYNVYVLALLVAALAAILSGIFLSKQDADILLLFPDHRGSPT